VDDSGTANKFVTAGEKADIATALQAGDNVSELANDAGYLNSVTASDVGLGNVDNTSDADKPVSNATQAALNSKVSSVTGDGVAGTSTDVTLSYPNADDVDDGVTINKFVTSNQINVINDQSGTNTGDETAATIQSKRPIKTVNGETLEGSGNVAISGGIQSVTGDGVDNADPSNPVLSFPDADQVSTSGTANKFVSQAEKDQITTNQTDILQNAADVLERIAKPSGPDFELDVLRRSATTGEYNSYTPVGGSVRFDNVAQNLNFTTNDVQDITADPAATFAGFSQFPRNVSNQFPGQDPVNDKATFLPFFYDTSTDRFKENSANGQSHFWRILIDYTKNNTQGNRELRVFWTNTTSGFELVETFIFPNNVVDNQFSVYFQTIADASSIANGYRLRLETVGAPVVINNISILRTSEEQL
jgi:hypothetical protein